MSSTSPFARGIVRIQAGGRVSLSVVSVVQAALLVHNLGEGVGGGECHTGTGLPDELRLQAIVVRVAVVGFRPDAIPVWIAARDIERVARRGGIRPEAIGGRRTPRRIPLLSVHDFVVRI